MKASAFSYARATSVVNALELLATHGDGAKLLSGGQSLMPMLNLRLAKPAILIDINDIPNLDTHYVLPTIIRAIVGCVANKKLNFRVRIEGVRIVLSEPTGAPGLW